MDTNVETNAYAVVKSGVVENIVVWDGRTDWGSGADRQTILVPSDTLVDIGYAYDGTEFVKPS